MLQKAGCAVNAAQLPMLARRFHQTFLPSDRVSQPVL
jgi:hypothetical protein